MVQRSVPDLDESWILSTVVRPAKTKAFHASLCELVTHTYIFSHVANLTAQVSMLSVNLM